MLYADANNSYKLTMTQCSGPFMSTVSVRPNSSHDNLSSLYAMTYEKRSCVHNVTCLAPKVHELSNQQQILVSGCRHVVLCFYRRIPLKVVAYFSRITYHKEFLDPMLILQWRLAPQTFAPSSIGIIDGGSVHCPHVITSSKRKTC